MALALSLKDACCDTETTMQKLKAELEAALKPGVEPFGYVSEHNCKGPFEYQFHKKRETVYPDNCRAIHTVYTTAPTAQTPCGYDATTGNCTNNPCCFLPMEMPPAQTPPPRLTEDEAQKMWDVACGSIPGWRRHLTFATAIETAVRKQFGVNDE
jgi:hypothetical protein